MIYLDHSTGQIKTTVRTTFHPLGWPFKTTTKQKISVVKDTEKLELLCIASGNPLQHSCLENPMDRGAWWAAVHGVVKSRTRLSDFSFTFHFYASEKEMATHSNVIAWRIPETGEPGGLPSVRLHRVGHD